MTYRARAWMLDSLEFHLALSSALGRDAYDHDDDGLLVWLRDEAVRVWHSKDPIVRTYVEVLPSAGPDDWEQGLDPTHAAEWYRLAMAPYLTPTRAYHAPEVLRRCLPHLGVPPTEARRLATGRDLQVLLDSHGDHPALAPLRAVVGPGHKGWLDHDDIQVALARLRGLDRRSFRDHQDLVPVVENAYEVLEAAATKPDHVLLLAAD